MSADPKTRELLLMETAVETAQGWIEHLRLELAREHRPMDGAWPGTVSEARARAGEAFRRAIIHRGMPAASPEEQGRLAHRTTDEARRIWRKLVKRAAP